MKYCQAMRPEKKKTPLSAGLMEVSPYFMSFPQLSVEINLTRDESCFFFLFALFPFVNRLPFHLSDPIIVFLSFYIGGSAKLKNI